MNISFITDIRKGRRIRQKVMAKAIGISTVYLSLIEGGKKKPSLEVLERICEYLDCELMIIPKTRNQAK